MTLKVLFTVGFVFTLFLIASTQKVLAASFTVDSTTDAVDASAGDGSCATSSGACTLRAAISEINALGGTNTITLPAGTYLITLTGAFSEDNNATGDFDIKKNVTINGAGITSTIIDANLLDRVIDTPASSSVTIDMSNLTLRNGVSTNVGGGIYIRSNVTSTLSKVKVTANNSGSQEGAGIDNDGTLTLSNVTVSANTTTGGGAVANDGTLTGTNLTISGNTASEGGGIDSFNTLTLTNSTISDNTVTNYGGGIASFSANTTVTNSTIAGNRVTSSNGLGAGIYMASAGKTIQLLNTLLFGNTGGGGNCYQANGTISSSGYNFSNDSSCTSYFSATGDRNNINMGLDDLEDNGGSILTIGLPNGSPAIDAGTNSGCPTSDARGISRPQAGSDNATATCDVGAFEFVNAHLPAPPFITSPITDLNVRLGWCKPISSGPNFMGTDTFISNEGVAKGLSVLVPKTAHHDDLYLWLDTTPVALLSNSLNRIYIGDVTKLAKVPVPWSQGLNTVTSIFMVSSVSSFNCYQEISTDHPFTIVLSYDPLRLYGLNPSVLKIAYYDIKSGKWKKLTSPLVLNRSNFTISSTTNKFSLYTVVYNAPVRFIP